MERHERKMLIDFLIIGVGVFALPIAFFATNHRVLGTLVLIASFVWTLDRAD